ncbi:isocitrate lyase/phosphoenolpyruvate mutase family protein [Homoserinimonas sp. OAct 916]|uniref:isocitrate lyase/PEP mutase family protein n=1 Tax=Homoserinimonas sp. OAct 916 TaxID=2211450 RepID=UPI000DBE780B|nr:isocitrate lyase/phosphoenolpyruvate mutase family protein [Homoserinimonas sp. OAct 916]
MTSPDLATSFLALHHGAGPLLIPNPWNVGSARLFASLGFRALATTSSGFAWTLGRWDGEVTREEALEHCGQIVRATPLPVSADLEHGFGDSPESVSETYELACRAGLAGASIEDSTGDPETPIREKEAAAERVRAAAQACHRGPAKLVLTGRAENFLHGRRDLADTIERLQAYQEAGADVLYAPGVTQLKDIRSIVTSVDRPVNVLAMADTPPVAALADAGVARISVGGAFAFAAVDAVQAAAKEFLEQGSYGYTARARSGRAAAIASAEGNTAAEANNAAEADNAAPEARPVD